MAAPDIREEDGRIAPRWFDVTTRWQMATACLQLNPAFKVPDGISLDAWVTAMKRVTRSQEVVLFVDELEWRKLRGVELSFRTDFVKVGRSSYTTSSVLMLETKPVVKVLTTIVAVNDSLEHSIPLPFADVIRKQMRHDAKHIAPSLEPLERCPCPANHFSWQTVARWVECDQLGHVNQSQYCLLMEEARATAAASGGYGDCINRDVAAAPPAKFQLSYFGQAHAGDRLSVLTWWDGQSFRCEILKIDEIGAEVQLLTVGRFWVKSDTLIPSTSKL